MKRLPYRLSVLLFLLILIAGQPAAAQDDRHVTIRLVPERSHVTAGDAIYIAIEQTIDPGWHTYWINPGDSGEPMQIDWHLPEGFEAKDIKWPTPDKMRIGPLASYGYTDKAILLQPLFIAETLPEGPVSIKADVEILVCADICIPEYSSHELVLNGNEPPQDNTELIDAAFFELPEEAVWPSTYHEENGEFVLDFEIQRPAVVQTFAANPDFNLIPGDWGVISNADPTHTALKDNLLRLRHKRGDRPLRSLSELNGIITYLDTAGSRRGFSFMARPEAMSPPQAPDIKTASAEEKKTDSVSLGQALVFALLGGLILNLMPCVFPVLSLKAIKLCKLSGQELNKARFDSLLYTGGILVSFTAFAFLLLGLRAAGEQVGWGFQLQNSGFVLFLTWLLFAIGLNLSGFFDIGSRLSGAGSRFVKGHGYLASFFTGVLAAVVATPCVAPFMGIAIGFALTQPVATILGVFLALGLGLALPYVLLAAVPALRSALPKPGPWMETFRQFMALPLYASAIWLGWVYAQQSGSIGILIVLFTALSIAFAVWILKKAPGTGTRSLKGFGFALLLLALGALIFTSMRGPAATMKGDWQPYTQESFAVLEAGNDPLFVNMTADWCITCKINERVALESQEVRTLFSDQKIVQVRGDWTNYNPEITRFLESYGRNGVPLYVYYGRRDERTGRRPAPEILPQLLTSGIVRQTILKTENKS